MLLLTITARTAGAQHHVAEACEAFETSHRLDPSTATLMNLADCREKNAQIQSACTAFLEAERQSRGDKKRRPNKTAQERATNLEARLSYLTVSVTRGNDVEGLTITRNWEPFDEGLWNTAIPVDGGSYVIVGRAPGHEEWWRCRGATRVATRSGCSANRGSVTWSPTRCARPTARTSRSPTPADCAPR